MIIVSNTSPINYLILIGQINLLCELFQQIIIPQAVYTELSAITRRSRSGSISITYTTTHPTSYVHLTRFDIITDAGQLS